MALRFQAEGALAPQLSPNAAADLLWSLTGPRLWAAMAWFALVRPGMVRRIAGAWAAYFHPGFHPWNQDDRALLVRDTAAPTAFAAQG